MKKKSDGFFEKKIDRREFLKDAAIGTAGIFIGTRTLTRKLENILEAQQSIVTICRDVNATSGSNVNQTIVQIMVDESIKNLTGLSAVGEAWKSLFTGITQSSIIGIKVNALYGPMSTNPEVVDAVINGLALMDFGGTNFEKNNVIIWDREDNDLINSGYTIYTGTNPDQARCFATDHAGVGYETFTWDIYGISKYPTKILGLCDFLIDISALKAHNLSNHSGVSMSLKNYYGAVFPYPGDLHATNCDPYIADLYAEDGIKLKQYFNIVDGLFGTYNAGPFSNPQNWQTFVEGTPNAILLSKDPVALDYIGKEQIIEVERAYQGMASIYAPHIHTASQPPYNLGTDDPAQIDLRWIINPSAIQEPRTPTPVFQFVAVVPNPAKKRVKIVYNLPQQSEVSVTIYDTSGRFIARLLSKTQNVGQHAVYWDIKDHRGNKMSPAPYLCCIEAGSMRIEQKIAIIR